MNPTLRLSSSWTRKDVADAHTEAALRELEKDPLTIDPYRYFLDAMRYVHGHTLLDVGCGSGHYSELLARFYPGIAYTGTDVSPHMIENARSLFPQAAFEVREFAENDFAGYDIILAGSVIEYAGTWEALDVLLRRAKQYVILHRIRLTPDKSRAFLEETYCGQTESHFVWNLEELKDFVGTRATIVSIILWDRQDHATIVVAKQVPNWSEAVLWTP